MWRKIGLATTTAWLWYLIHGMRSNKHPGIFLCCLWFTQPRWSKRLIQRFSSSHSQAFKDEGFPEKTNKTWRTSGWKPLPICTPYSLLSNATDHAAIAHHTAHSCGGGFCAPGDNTSSGRGRQARQAPSFILTAMYRVRRNGSQNTELGQLTPVRLA